jgi:ABC-2 type transport system permease protein
MTESAGELFDLGYRRYDGPREGRIRARKALYTNGVRILLGLGRGSSSKVLPLIFFIVVMAPAVILAFIASVAEDIDIPTHSDYYQIVSVLLTLFAAIMAPELLCPDRRSGVLGLYLVRPMTSTDYVAARWLAFFSITLLLVYSGQILLLVGLTLGADNPLDYLKDNWLDIPRFLGAGLVIAIFATTLPLTVSAFTTRRAYATAFAIGIIFLSSLVSGILTECDDHGPGDSFEQCEPLTRDYAKWFRLINITGVTLHLNDIIFDEDDISSSPGHISELNNSIPIGWYALVMLALGFVLWWRYRRIAA